METKVYILWTKDCECDLFHGLFSSIEKAEERIDRLMIENNYQEQIRSWFSIEEWEVDG